MKYTIPCLFGLEALVADELRRLDLKNVRAENGRVHCDGGPAVGLCGRGEIVAHLRETARSIQRQVADQAASVWKGIGLRTSWLTHGTSSLLPPPQRGVFPIIMQTAENVEMPAGSCRNCRRRAGRFCNQNEMVFAKWA